MLLSHLLFRYLQLCHAIRAQFVNLKVTIDPPPVLNIIMGEDPTKLISNLYSILRLQRTLAVTQVAKNDVGSINNMA